MRHTSHPKFWISLGLLPLVLLLALACTSETVKEVPVEVVVVKEVVKEVMVPGETVVVEKEVVREVQIPGETVVVKEEVIKEVPVEVVVVKEVVKEVMVPGETVVVEKEVVKEVEVEVVVEKEVVKEVEVEVEVVVEKVVVKEVEVEVVVEKEVIKEVPVEKVVVVEKEVIKEVPVEKVVVVEKEVPAPAPEKVLRVRMTSMPESFVPHTERSGALPQITAFVYGTLKQSDPQNKEWAPNLAERWEVSPDASSVTYYIRKGARFHDGEPVTAEDLAFTLKSLITPETGTRRGSTYKMIQGAAELLEGTSSELPGVTVLDDYTLKIDLNTPNATFLGVIGGTFGVLPEHILGSVAAEDIVTHRHFSDEMVGFGPYKLVKFSPGQFMELEAYDEYHFGRPNIDRIIIRIIASPDATQIAMQREEIELNIRGDLSSDAYRAFLQDPRFRVIGGQSTIIRASNINHAVEDLRDVRIRQAMVYALDRQKLIDVFHNGLATIHNQPLIHGWIQKPEWQNRYPFDPDMARSLLQDAGWDSEREVDLDVYGAQSDEIRTELAAMQQMWKDVGLKINIVEKDVGTMLEEWDAVTYPGLQRWGWGTFADPDGFLQTYFTTVSANNMNYATPELDAKIELGLTSVDREKRREIYQEIAEQLMEDLPLLVEYVPLKVRVIHNRFHLPLWADFPRATSIGNLPIASIFSSEYEYFEYHMEQWDLRD